MVSLLGVRAYLDRRCDLSVKFRLEPVTIWEHTDVCAEHYILVTVSEKCPSFSDFAGNLCSQKPNKENMKQANVTGVNYLYPYQQVV